MSDAALHDPYALIARRTAEGAPFVVATVVRTVAATAAKAGAKAVIDADGTIHGWIGGGCAQGAVRTAARRCLADGTARLISVVPADEIEAARAATGPLQAGREYHRSHCPSRGTLDIFLEPMLPRPALVVAGATPVGIAVAELAARTGFAATLLAAPAELAAPPPGVTVAERLPERPPRTDRWIVVATQGRDDEGRLKEALAAGDTRVAFVASRAKWATVRTWLAEDGVPAAALDRVKAPAGLDLGAITPEEIALSILAAIVRDRRRTARETGAEQRAA